MITNITSTPHSVSNSATTNPWQLLLENMGSYIQDLPSSASSLKGLLEGMWSFAFVGPGSPFGTAFAKLQDDFNAGNYSALESDYQTLCNTPPPVLTPSEVIVSTMQELQILQQTITENPTPSQKEEIDGLEEGMGVISGAYSADLPSKFNADSCSVFAAAMNAYDGANPVTPAIYQNFLNQIQNLLNDLTST